ncbi:Las1-like-domain-containing protein [Hygrophoropsis aurantiaca]|uniref:Las1-like-domain-containing protein n=1 Tax=Hygrophoropsis aurantiaca TaxID=72124 RepID=A0ACB8AHP5_9AGAM|nr:Las1-like-domain-containing protein [Hygrophoropsis aurantiaca]
MRLPRRVPWSHIQELEQICSWIFNDENDIEAKQLAITRLSAWKAITSLPHALESTLAILSVHLLDNTSYQKSGEHSQSNLTLRQSYATAIIRMVNGLVDPLQVGAYARSIASIAAQLGLPSWLVELRHAATHENLPSLILLREAARESLSWLLHNYFLPTLNPSSTSAPAPPPLRSVSPLLKRYKTLLKTITRDASLRNRYKPDVDSVMRDVERWIAEAKISAGGTVNDVGWESYGATRTDQDILQERWALDTLCDALMERGALVPLGKKCVSGTTTSMIRSKRRLRKRVGPADSYLPPRNSLALWTPLLVHLQSNHPHFAHTLAGRLTSFLLSDHRALRGDTDRILNQSDINSSDPSYDLCLARWVAWIVQTWDDDETDNGLDLRKDIVLMLASTLVPGGSGGIYNVDILTTLIDEISKGFPAFQTTSELLLSIKGAVPQQQWHSDALTEMNSRLETLMSCDITSTEVSVETTKTQSIAAQAQSITQAEGWKLLHSHSFWKPCPIGIFVHSS